MNSPRLLADSMPTPILIDTVEDCIEHLDALVASALLLAPAIDNYERNFRNVPAEDWYMPPAYVAELQGLPPRPRIDTRLVPTVVLHGRDDTDQGGSAPWRVEEWTAEEWASSSSAEQRRCAVHMPLGVDHSLEP